MPAPMERGEMSRQMCTAVELVLGGMSWRKAAAAAGVSVSGLTLAMRRHRDEQRAIDGAPSEMRGVAADAVAGSTRLVESGSNP